MTKVVGLDWASKGWFGVVLDDGDWETDLFPSIGSVWKYHSDAARILIDVPIGLPTERKRTCDVAAKERLGRQHRSVFYAPVRRAVYEGNLDEAKRINERAGFSIQNQAWNLVPRIREVDEFLDSFPGARDRLVETHPETCFHALNGRTALDAPKRTAEGVARRKGLLADEFPDATVIYESSVDRYTKPDYASFVGGEHDLLDALVAAATARRDPDRLATLPEDPPTDERGLPMRIVYPADTRQIRLSALDSRD